MGRREFKGITRRAFLSAASTTAGAAGVGLGLADHASSLLTRTTREPKRVMVVGAGLAGLAAAWELNAAGHDVTLFEARTRPGGRVSTLRDPFADGLYAECGALAFSPAYSAANRYIDALGLERLDWKIPDLEALYYLKGRRFSVGKGDKIRWPYALTGREQDLGPMGIFRRYLLEALPPEVSEAASWSRSPLRELDKMTLGEYMRSQGASAGAVELLRFTQWFGTGVDSLSMLSAAVSALGLFMSGPPFVLAGGNDRLPTAMAARLKENIRYGARVVAIRDTGPAVEVTVRRGTRIDREAVDRVICTLPAVLLKDLEIEPDLEAAQRSALSNLPYLDTTRIFLQVGRCFWFDEGVTGTASTDLSIAEVGRQPVSNLGGPRERIILESHVRGSIARSVQLRTETEMIERTVREMRNVHPEIVRYQEGGTVKAWSEDPYAGSAYSWPSPGDVTRYLKLLQRAHGRIHFAGEHTSILHASMEGALRSGIRAAREVDDA